MSDRTSTMCVTDFVHRVNSKCKQNGLCLNSRGVSTAVQFKNLLCFRIILASNDKTCIDLKAKKPGFARQKTTEGNATLNSAQCKAHNCYMN